MATSYKLLWQEERARLRNVADAVRALIRAATPYVASCGCGGKDPLCPCAALGAAVRQGQRALEEETVHQSKGSSPEHHP